ncbi:MULTISPECIES: outer membrane lipoprotein-sorting protein [unclassified Serratia (in: enterobacteria)]|uniref:outer membrane lipoprotein-sorting protein n=1 Tax=unclassified Serratia (in: enterobacteria) TaxID=2647522 RepID=UPI001E317228|nr:MULTISPECIES: outer membrane lipoprotein-sorting protein [unclassified Serratia (in: enterobacteria)]
MTWADTASTVDIAALEIIKKSDEVRSPNMPFRYTVTIKEFKPEESEPIRKQILDISMRFLKPGNGIEADARSLSRFVYPPRDKGKMMLSDWYDLWFYTPGLRRPMPISRQQRLLGQISNGDVIVTNFEYAYNSILLGEEPCGNLVCYKLALERKSPEITYPKVTYLVEKESYHPYKAFYFSLDDKLIKEVAYQDYKYLLGRERPAKIVIVDARSGNGYSVMEYSDVRYESLPLFHFTKEYIQRGGN